MNKLQSTSLVVISSVLFALAIPNEVFLQGSSFLGLIALSPLYLALYKQKSIKFSGFLGGLAMLIIHLLSSFWLANFKEFAIFTLGGSALATFLMGIPVGIALSFLFKSKTKYKPIGFAVIWTLWEWLKSTGFFAYPWGTIPMSMANSVYLIQITDITGVWGISFFCSFISANIAELILKLSNKKYKKITPNLLGLFSIFVIFFLYGVLRIPTLPSKIDSSDLLLIQQNEDSWDSGNFLSPLIKSQKVTRNGVDYLKDKNIDLIVWNEGILPYVYTTNKNWYKKNPENDPFLDFLTYINTPLLTGGPFYKDLESRDLHNSAILLNSQGEVIDWYGKIHLVPFAEHMPFTEYEFVRKFFNKIVGFSSGWAPGKAKTTMPLYLQSGNTINYISPICFEDAFPSLLAKLKREGADLIINLTNDSWSKTNSAEIQHSVLASFRAVELRCPLIRSTNAGHSVIYDQTGAIIYELPLFVEDFLYCNVPIYPRSLTIYAKAGDWFPIFLLILLILNFFYSLLSKNVLGDKSL